MLDDAAAPVGAARLVSIDGLRVSFQTREGRVAGHLARHELTEENIVRLGMHHA